MGETSLALVDAQEESVEAETAERVCVERYLWVRWTSSKVYKKLLWLVDKEQ